MRTSRARIAGLAAALAVALAVLAPSPQRTGVSAGSGGFVAVGVHPGAVEQTTDRGRAISALEAWRGRLYAGYGDYGANTGPIGIWPYDPLTGAFDRDWVSDTEAVFNYRPIRDRLYAPAIDRRASADYAVGEPWSDELPIVTTHAFDMATLDGRDLWLVGSHGYDAVAWRSMDDGATWQESLRLGAASGVEGDFARFYFAGVLGGRLYVQAVDYHGGPQPRSRVFDGAWAEGPDLLPGGGLGWRPLPFAGQLVYQKWQPVGQLLAFDGVSAVAALGWNALGLAVVGDELYVLRAGRDPGSGERGPATVLRTTDLRTWSELAAPLPEGSASLAVLDGVLYVGTAASALHRFEGEAEWRPAAVRWSWPPVRLPYAARP